MIKRVPAWRKKLIRKMEDEEELIYNRRRDAILARGRDMRTKAWICHGCGMTMPWHRKQIKFINVTLGLELNFHNQACKIAWIHNKKRKI